MSPEANFSQLILWIVNVFNLKIFASNLSFIYLAGSGYVFGIWIRIHKGPEYGSILDPDPQRWQEYEKKKSDSVTQTCGVRPVEIRTNLLHGGPAKIDG